MFTFENCTSPGIDGVSIEFYKTTFHIIKNDLCDVINSMLNRKFIQRKIKTGITKLIHKGGDEFDIKNYRPITLINVDLKIFSKIIDERLKPILDELLHDTQFAKKEVLLKI